MNEVKKMLTKKDVLPFKKAVSYNKKAERNAICSFKILHNNTKKDFLLIPLAKDFDMIYLNYPTKKNQNNMILKNNKITIKHALYEIELYK